MAMYVVLQFGSDEEAEKFVQAEQRDDVVLFNDGKKGSARRLDDYEVMGLFKAPTQFCVCPGSKGRIQAWAKGQKYGWWVCKACGKPANATGGPTQLMRYVVGQANNLLSRFHHDAPEVEPTSLSVGEGMGSLREGQELPTPMGRGR